MRRLGNLSLWAVNLGAAAVIGSVDSDTTPLSPIALAGGILVLDALTYALHRAQHCATVIWQIHKLHHSDKTVDVTTAVRHHPFEVIMATPFLWLTVGICHLSAAVVGVYGVVVLVSELVTHTRRPWPQWIEQSLTPIFITRETHLLHHSADPAEADANFGGIFCWWDRIFGTFAPGRVPERFGV